MIDLRIRSTQKRRMCSCPHLKDFKKADGFKVFRKVHAHFVCCGSREARKRKVHMLVNFRNRSKLVLKCICRLYFHIFNFPSLRQACVTVTNVEHIQVVSIPVFCAYILVAIPETGTFTITQNPPVIL